ncbi:inorganic pyrophosphatase [bacterium BMS3Abin05]|nr:inorganic pyrophosphatase [bacterium BMS3Abin05]GBE27093.1 inorganic pyrophosphatase [bacterium BMS3Bbin03]HDZ12608.1 inorganic pyrophosphatase [Bacteroidota bacterium]
MNDHSEPAWKLFGQFFQAHPWHGIPVGKNAPEIVNAYIEIVPTDTVKYELDKQTGLLKIDRPQKFSSMPPMLYGLIPRTFCGKRIGDFCTEKTGRKNVVGDGDPLDICILTERPISHGNIIVTAVSIGGFRMIDGNEADDKIIAYLKNDPIFSQWKDISDMPEALLERLRHYFLTYKDIPGSVEHNTEITHVYGREEALEIIRLSFEDYNEKFAGLWVR